MAAPSRPERSTDPSPDRYRDALVLTSLMLLGLGFVGELATIQGVPVARDIQRFFIPHRHILWEALQQGRLPLWTSLIGTGYPVLANFQSGVFYPPHWLYGIVSFLAAFNWLIVLHLLLGGVGMYAFCREIRFSRAASWITAVSFMLGGYFVSLTNLVNVLQTAAWVPLMTLALIRQVKKPVPFSFAIVVGVHLVAFLAGAPFTFVLGAGLSATYVVLKTRELDDTSLTTVVLTLTATGIVIAGLAAIQLLPTLQMVAESNRSAGLSFENASQLSAEPIRLLQLVLPNDLSDPAYNFGLKLQITSQVPWLYSVYLGVVPLVLIFCSPRDSERRKEVLFWACVAIVGMVLTLGRHTPAFRLVHQFVPGFDSFRYPEKFFLFTALASAMLVGHGFRALRRRAEWSRWSMVAVSLLAGIGLAVAAFWEIAPEAAQSTISSLFANRRAGQHPEFAYSAWQGTLFRLAALLSSSVLLIWLHRRKLMTTRVFVPLIALLVAADLWLAHRQLIPTVDPSFYRGTPRVAQMVPMEELRSRYRYRSSPFDERVGSFYADPRLSIATEKWIAQQTIQPSIGPLYGIMTLDSDDAIQLKASDRRRGLLRGLPDRARWRLLELHGVKYLFSPRDFREDFYARRTALDSLPGFIYELDSPVSRAYVGRASLHPNDSSVYRAMITSDPGGRKPVALDADSGGRAPRPLRKWTGDQPAYDLESAILDSLHGATEDPDVGTAEVISDRGERVQIRVDVDRASFLLLTDSDYPGWTAVVDGEKRPVLRANYFFRAVPLLPGDSHVVFRYDSSPLKTGAWISGTSVMLLMAVLAVWRRRTRVGPVSSTDSKSG